METPRVVGNRRTTGTNDRGRSSQIWYDCPIDSIAKGIVLGTHFFDDFTSFPKTPATTEGNWGQYAQFSSTGGTITAGTGTGGEAALGSDGDDEGASIRTLSTPFKISRSNYRCWFECRVKSSTVADTKHGFFIGFLENVALTATVPIAADGTLSDNNLFGFHRLEADGDQIDWVYKANGVTQVSIATDIVTGGLAADTYVKLGFRYDRVGERNPYAPQGSSINFYLTAFVNGIPVSTQKQVPSADGTDFPNDVGMGLVFAVLNATASTPGTSTLDWWAAAQVAEAW